MKIITSNELQSTGYRCLFEGVKQEGVEPFLELANDIQNISNNRDILIEQTIFNRSNDLTILKRKHRDIIKYLRKHKKELTRLSFTNKNILNILDCLLYDSSLIDLYIENARKLEELKIDGVEITTFKNHYSKVFTICRNNLGDVINITKYYTDGIIKQTSDKKVLNPLTDYSVIPFKIDSSNMSFILRAETTNYLRQFRDISIEHFGFDSTKLPSEEELESYEIPKELINKKIK